MTMQNAHAQFTITGIVKDKNDEPPQAALGQALIGSLAPVTAAAGLIAADYAILTLLGVRGA